MRESRKQRERRVLEQRERRQAWRCAVCRGPVTDYVRGRRLTCSADCARLLRADQQSERRWSLQTSAVLNKLER